MKKNITIGLALAVALVATNAFARKEIDFENHGKIPVSIQLINGSGKICNETILKPNFEWEVPFKERFKNERNGCYTAKKIKQIIITNLNNPSDKIVIDGPFEEDHDVHIMSEGNMIKVSHELDD